MNQQVLAACFTLAKLTYTNPKTEQTDAIIMEGLHADESDTEILQKLHDEKDKLVPNCKFCSDRCGNSDDMFPEMKEGSYKEKVFACAKQSTNIPLVIEALARIASDQDEDTYQKMYERMKREG